MAPDSSTITPSTSTPSKSTSKAGIITDEAGNSHIPSSVRADGSVRREIRIRPGYRPPEDVEVYRNRTAEAWRNRGSGKGVIPGAESIDDKKDDGKKTGDSGAGSAASNKNAKRREARKRAAAAKAEGGDEAENLGEASKPEEEKEVDKPVDVQPNEDAGKPIGGEPEVDKQKEAKKLLKKLRQARELKDKKDQGGALLPEQFEKVIRINELIRQLDSLGFNSEGEKKGEGEAS